MLGLAVYHFHMSPDDFWKMTAQEFWAVMRAANPEIDAAINTKRTNGLFNDEEKAQLEEMLQKYG